MGANFEPFVIYNFSMRRHKNLYSCRKLQQLEFCCLRVVFTDLGFGAELSMAPHGKVSKCFIIVIYVFKKSKKHSTILRPKRFAF